MATLPSFFLMRATSQGAFLCAQDKPPSNRPPGFLRFNEPEILSPRVKFAMESIGWHIGCKDEIWVGASANKPEEDRTKIGCTLFQVSRSGTQGFCFIDIARNLNLGSNDNGLAAMSWRETEFHVVDWETLVILPSRVTFRSEDPDGNYLCSRVIEKWYNYHRFESGLDVGDPLVAYELFPTREGNYRVKNLHFGNFWRRSPNWIWANADDNDNSNDTLFSFVKLDKDIFAIRNLGNNRFCGGLTTEGKEDCLNAQYDNISRQTNIKVEERILRREISDIRYRLADSRIYQEELKELAYAFGINDSPDHDSTIILEYFESDSNTSHCLSVTLDVTTSLEASVPLITTVGLELSTELGRTHEWGVSETTERTRTATYTVVVPPLTTMKVTHKCSKAASDVPFSYTQRDLLTTGEWISIDKDVGVFKAVNTFNFHFQSEKVVPDAQGRLFE
ncbi:uncharacterized protein LOC143597420 [Bidens hawaiensis]|uniref:uncharacterized protein LOC143597420 n=1 Tax=Bidens hawaiensis TaxID=980011 RepID=UPI00404A1313